MNFELNSSLWQGRLDHEDFVNFQCYPRPENEVDHDEIECNLILHTAILRHHPKGTILALLEAGADPNLKCANGFGAVGCAVKELDPDPKFIDELGYGGLHPVIYHHLRLRGAAEVLTPKLLSGLSR
ncbi:MAG: hypothetical protein U5O39_19940 [Gammaproteobacteria bacterium]|nr:hypothetical protein [Gammaproteobacteria bacterium]